MVRPDLCLTVLKKQNIFKKTKQNKLIVHMKTTLCFEMWSVIDEPYILVTSSGDI